MNLTLPQRLIVSRALLRLENVIREDRKGKIYDDVAHEIREIRSIVEKNMQRLCRWKESLVVSLPDPIPIKILQDDPPPSEPNARAVVVPLKKKQSRESFDLVDIYDDLKDLSPSGALDVISNQNFDILFSYLDKTTVFFHSENTLTYEVKKSSCNGISAQ